MPGPMLRTRRVRKEQRAKGSDLGTNSFYGTLWALAGQAASQLGLTSPAATSLRPAVDAKGHSADGEVSKS